MPTVVGFTVMGWAVEAVIDEIKEATGYQLAAIPCAPLKFYVDPNAGEATPQITVSETKLAICAHCGEQISYSELIEEWVHRADLSGEEDAFIGEPLCKIPGLTWIEQVTEAANGNGIYAEPLSVVGAKLPEGLCGVTSRNGEHCVFTPHEGKHSWQRR